MSDQNKITDWAAHFASLGPKPPSTVADFSPMYAGEPNPHVVYMKDPKTGELEAVPVEDGDLFGRAKAIYEANGGPEMWIFSHMTGPSWHCPPSPQPKGKK